MASSCGSSYTSSQETTNFARICRIVVDVFRDILWQVLTHEIPAADLPNRVSTNQNRLGKLDVKIKTWLCGISPSFPVIPIAENFDITSLYTLIRNLCSNVPTPSAKWGTMPPPGGTTLGDDMERLREFRNTFYGHAKQAKIVNADFNSLCTDIKNVVGRFDVYFSSNCSGMKCDFKSEIDTILTCSMDKALQDTYIAKMNEIAILSGDLDNVKQQVVEVKQEIVDVKQEIGDVKQEIGDVKQEVKQQVGNVKQEMDDLKQHFERESRNKRRESAELKRLKESTEDLLDTARLINFVPTEQADKIRCHLQQHDWVTIEGNPGEGKTTTALRLLDEFGKKDHRVVVQSPVDWRMVDTKYVDFVFIEDIFGRFDLESNCLDEWCRCLQDIERYNEGGKLKVIITTRVDILSKSSSKLGTLKFFRKSHVQTLSSKKLRDSERKDMLERMLEKKRRNMDDELQLQCLRNFKGSLGFPQCCSLFSGEEDLFKKGPEFFSEPEEFFLENIKTYTGQKLLLFAFLFCNDGCFLEKIISPGPMPQRNMDQLDDLARWLGVDQSSTTILRNECRHYSGVYIERSGQYIRFTHATIYEAVGTVLGEQAPEVVIKYCSSDFLFQRIHYVNDSILPTNQICICEALYDLLADRIISKDLKKGNIERFAYFSYLNHGEFVKIFAKKLSHLSKTENFLRTESSQYFDKSNQDKQLNGICLTILEHCLRRNPKTDSDTVNFVFDTFIKPLSCITTKSCSCWKCIERQNLLELSLYYGHFDITHKLLKLNVVLTPVSLCNAARHGKVNEVQSILKTLKQLGKLDPQEQLIKLSLCRAIISGSRLVVDLLLEEGILLDFENLETTVRGGDCTAVTDVIKHLKTNGHWPEAIKSSPKSLIPTALKVAYVEGKYDVADLLVREGVHLEMHMLHIVVKDCSIDAVRRMIVHLKDTNKWDPQSKGALEALEVCTSLQSYIEGKEEKVKLLCNEGMTFTSIQSLPYLVCYEPSSAIELVQFLKAKGTWVSQLLRSKVEALENAFLYKRNELCDILINNGLKLTLENLPNLVKRASDESDVISTVIQHLKDHNNWNSTSDHASVALQQAYTWRKKNISELLKKEGCTISLAQNQCDIAKFITQTSDINVGECFNEVDGLTENELEKFEVLKEAFMFENAGWCDMLIKAGVKLSTEHLFEVVCRASDNAIIKIIEHLKEKKTWEARSKAASGSLMMLFIREKTELLDLLIHEGVTVGMSNLPGIVHNASDSVLLKVIKHLKEVKEWDVLSPSASSALMMAFRLEKMEVCDLLIKEGITLSMWNLKSENYQLQESCLIKVIEHLKVKKKWDRNSNYASDALMLACRKSDTEQCDVLLQEGVTVRMTDLPNVVENASHDFIIKVIKNLKEVEKWDVLSPGASSALMMAFRLEKMEVCDLLIKEGITLSMENLKSENYQLQESCLIKVIEHLKVKKKWDPKSNYASDALMLACRKSYTELCDVLLQEGVTVRMTDLPDVVENASHDFIIKVIKDLKEVEKWDVLSPGASSALMMAFRLEKMEVCDLLIKEGITLSMENLKSENYQLQESCLIKVIEHLKVKKKWDPKSNYASDALMLACRKSDTELCDVLLQEGVTVRMTDLPDVVENASHDFIIKVIKNLKEVEKWDVLSPGASSALMMAFRLEKMEVRDLLIKEGITLSMENLKFEMQESCLIKVIEHLKVKEKWDPESNCASDVLMLACRESDTELCDVLLQEGVTVRMTDLPKVVKCTSNCASDVLMLACRESDTELCDVLLQEGVTVRKTNLPKVVKRTSHVFIIKQIELLKVKKKWEPESNYASDALMLACRKSDTELCDVLLQEGVTVRMTDLPNVVENASHDFIIKVIKNLKEVENWDVLSPWASSALMMAFRLEKMEVCDLLIKEGITLSMWNLKSEKYQLQESCLIKVIEHLKVKKKWDPKSNYASDALMLACRKSDTELCDVLLQEGVTVRMTDLPDVVENASHDFIIKVIKNLKEVEKWDVLSPGASSALMMAFRLEKMEVCDLLIKEGITLSMENLKSEKYQLQESCLIKVIEHLKVKKKWDPKSNYASDALMLACRKSYTELCDVLLQEGVTLTHPALIRFLH